ncbi:MAG: PfkB family carbohydrate kinase [Phycisphaerae bacterium]
MMNNPLELVALVERFGHPRIMVIGDLMVDEYIYGNAERLSPEAPVPVVKEKYREQRAGGAGNVAADLAVLGAQVVCVAIRGNDHQGQLLVSLLQKAGVQTTGVLGFADRPTTSKTRLVGLAQHRHPQQMLRLDQEDTRPISADEEQQLFNYIAAELLTCDLVCLEDYNKGLLTAPFCQRIVALARTLKKPVLVDPAAITDYSKYRGVSTITPNRTEAEQASGVVLAEGIDTAPQLAKALTKQMELEACVLTLDRHGVYLLERHADGTLHGQHHPTRQRNVYDVTGAGDMVLATLAMARATGATWSQAVDLANVAGGLEVERFGCVPIQKAEILAELLALAGQTHGKLLALADLATELTRRRKLGQKIAFTHGLFDVLTAGDVQHLQLSRQQGDVLVVGVHTDESVQNMQGQSQSINTLSERGEVLAALAAVDFITPYSEETAAEIIAALVPDVLVQDAPHMDHPRSSGRKPGAR